MIDLHRIDTRCWNVPAERMFKEGIDNLNGSKNSLLIEGLLLNLPFPKTIALRFNYGTNVKTITNDSRNLVSAWDSFMKNEYELEGCNAMAGLNGKFFKDLLPWQQRRLTEKEVSCIIDMSCTSPEQQYLSAYFDLL